MGQAELQALKRINTQKAMLPGIEPLDRRLLLSTRMVGLTVRIVGTDAADLVIVAVNKRFINVLTVTENDSTFNVALSAVGKIEIRTHGGDDKIWVDSTLDGLKRRSYIDAAAGSDTITTGAGADTILGGEGNDKIYSNGGNDVLLGGGGKDLLVAGTGDDSLWGGTANDRLNGDAGNDALYGEQGDDLLDAGEGDDGIIDAQGISTVMAGAGADRVDVEGAGTIWGGAGNDRLTFLGPGTVYGEQGDDSIYGQFVWGGDGSDTITGTLGPDELRGDGGDDFIEGRRGNDAILGGDGNDALYGGSDNDKLWGEAGDDNLYGNDGATDTKRADDGQDTALGHDGADWWQPDYRWVKTDKNKSDRGTLQQNYIVQDPGYGLNNWNSSSSGSINLTSGGNYGSFNYNMFLGTVFEHQALADAGWLSTGGYDDATQSLVPPTSGLSTIGVTNAIVQLPASWQVSPVSSTASGLSWYRISLPNPQFAVSGTTVVRTADGGAVATVPVTLPGLFDGVMGGKFRFLGVMRGTIIINDAAVAATEAQTWSLSTMALALPTQGSIRLAGDERIYSLAATFDQLPTGGPRLRGILVEGGAIWLPQDGSAPYFSSGKRAAGQPA
jgi:hypothetical protein